MSERHGGLRADRVVEHRRGDERIAVAVAADPRTHAEERRQAPRGIERERGAQLRFERRVEPGHLGEEGVAVVRRARCRFRPSPPAATAGSWPSATAAGRCAAGRSRPPRTRRGPCAIRSRRSSSRAIARSASRMLLRCTSVGCAVSTGETIAASSQPATATASTAFGADARQRVGQAAALRRRPGERVRAAPPVLVDVLGDVREVREVAERANHVERLRDRQRIEQRGEFGPHTVGVGARGAAKADGGAADRLDPVEAVLPGLVAQHVAEHPAQQPRVVLQRLVLVGSGVHGRSAEGAAGKGSIVASLRDAPNRLSSSAPMRCVRTFPAHS